jgi:hypothetical protein
MSTLHESQLRWANMLRRAQPTPEEVLLDEPLEYNRRDLQAPCILEVDRPDLDRNINGFGECKVCSRWRRVWNSVCAWCGHDSEDCNEE